jgi:hypothetical protein
MLRISQINNETFNNLFSRREQQLAMYAKKRKSILRPVIRQEVRLDRLSKKRAYKSGSEPTRYGIIFSVTVIPFPIIHVLFK